MNWYSPDMAYMAEEAECANMYLDDLKIPSCIGKGARRLSLVGRIKAALRRLDEARWDDVLNLALKAAVTDDDFEAIKSCQD